VLVTLGARGGAARRANQGRHFPAVPVAAVDPTAAGDAFIGSLAVFLPSECRVTWKRRSARPVAVAA